MRSPFLKIFPLLAAIGFFAVSCDKDYNELGSSIVDDDNHFGFDLHESDVVAYNKFYGAVQTSKNTTSQIDMPINALGYYNNAAFGKVKASFVTQLELDDPDPTIDLALDPLIDKVELNIPYFATMTETDDDGNHLYELDSIQGSSKIKLSVYPSGYYLRDFDPGTGGPGTGFQQIQKYYSDQTAEIYAAISPTETRLNNSTDPKQNDEFYFDPAEIVTYTTDDDGLQVVDERRGPEMRLQLRNDYFQQKLFSTDAAGKLVNNNVFKEWVRGLYFKVDANSPDQGSLNKINFKNGTITVTYTEKVSASSTERTGPKTLQLNLAGNTVNLFENEYSGNYLAGVGANDENADDRLWLKGGAGSMAVIRLFEPGQREILRDSNWLINDASLTFYVYDALMNGEEPAYRIYIYDLKNKKRLVDYDYDVTTIAAAPQFNKYVHGGIFQKNPAKRRYTIRLTNHMRNLLDPEIDSTNVELGLVVTETINSTYNTMLRTPLSETIDRIPGATTTSQRGVVLHGSTPNQAPNNQPGNEAQRIKLKIYYTKKD
jgi:hypothetical protein